MKSTLLLAMLCLSGFCYGQVNQKKGYTNTSEMGVLLGQVGPNNSSPVSKTSFTASSFNGYRLMHWLAAGITVGLDSYKGNLMVPISLGLRGDILKNKTVTPFYALDIGKGMTWLARDPSLDFKRGGLHLNPAIGLRFATNSGTAITWSVGYKRQILESGRYFGEDQGTYYDYAYNRISIKMGMSF
ncbi:MULTISPECIES: hypothetical protein [unclassified Siphonobacter]|uniref:hypothetical protein n=1 Tax=unclassified Siphonobacter TaxID=2635712 RepID=UPI0012FE97FB|nr:MULTISPECIES: hypothetical protein [unclassified Siphonobacter]MDQ1087069.1 hypothetical protein [Siphonobacter sp. SORGH_AS_1065]